MAQIEKRERKAKTFLDKYIKNIFDKDFKKNTTGYYIDELGHTKFKVEVELFKGSDVEKNVVKTEVKEPTPVVKEEAKNERTPLEKYIYLSSLGTILDLAEKGTRLSSIKGKMRKGGKENIDKFIKAGVFEVSSQDKGIAVVHRENLIEYFKDTYAAMVLRACMNNPGIKPEDAAKIIPVPKTSIDKERRRLLKTGFLERKKPYDTEMILLTKYSEGLGIDKWGMEAKIEKLWSERGQKAV